MQGSDPRMRVSDADRDAVVGLLRDARVEGRLDAEEFEDRMRLGYAAKTVQDLQRLLTDLPASWRPGEGVVAAVGPDLRKPDAGGAASRNDFAVTPSGRAAAVRAAITSQVAHWVSVSVLLTAIWVVSVVTSGHLQHFWPAWPIGIWGAILVARGVRIGSDPDFAARYARREQQRQRRRNDGRRGR